MKKLLNNLWIYVFIAFSGGRNGEMCINNYIMPYIRNPVSLNSDFAKYNLIPGFSCTLNYNHC